MSEDEDTEQSTVDLVKYTYSVKLVNRSKKSEFRVYNVRDEVRFTDMEVLLRHDLKNLMIVMIYALAT